MSYEYKQFYRRKLPHIHSPGSTLFVTFRLAGSIPKKVLQQWLAEKSLLARQPSTEEFGRIVRYVLNNPVKAGLVEDWSKWPWTYCRPGLGFS